MNPGELVTLDRDLLFYYDSLRPYSRTVIISKGTKLLYLKADRDIRLDNNYKPTRCDLKLFYLYKNQVVFRETYNYYDFDINKFIEKSSKTITKNLINEFI